MLQGALLETRDDYQHSITAVNHELHEGRLLRARAFFDVHDAGIQLGVFPKAGTAGQRALLMLRGFGLRNG
jgi:hypothetical protein